MENFLLYYYNIRVKKIINDNSAFYFNYNGDYYYFVPFNKNINSFENVLTMYELLNKELYESHVMIKNRFNSYISLVNKAEYILLKIKKAPNLIIDFPILVNNSKKMIAFNSGINHKLEWDILWQKKIDYLENQIRKLGNGKSELINSFSYYVGLAENAIIYYKNIKISKKSMKYSIQHRRIFIPNNWLNYGNPLSMKIDHPERDVAEYLKYNFFLGNEDDAYNDFAYLVKANYNDSVDWKLLFSRLLFPTYYFDVFERAIVNNSCDEELIKIVEKANHYEFFLKRCYNIVNNYVTLDEFPEWLL